MALDDGLLPLGTTVFDYGCGRGGDFQRLQALGYDATGWDPIHRANGERRSADVVNLGYVVNVIESPAERLEVLRQAWALTRRVLVVSARSEWESANVRGRAFADGMLTGTGTFQKFFNQEELRSWIDGELGVRSVAASPGIFYVFRSEMQAQTFLSARVRLRPARIRRPRVSEALYEANRDILEPLMAFIDSRGRAPEPFELSEAEAARIRFGSVKAALAVVRRVTGDETWRAAQLAGRDDLDVYLALAAFGGRPKLSNLPVDLQLDVKAFHGSYKEACAVADALLFQAGDHHARERAYRESAVGKLTPEALYVHVRALPEISPLLRVLEGCARALTGSVEGATIIKFNRIEPKVSYLVYPDFDRDPHPSLMMSVRADLRGLHVKVRDFANSNNPPILHRKETFVAHNYPGRAKFARLTAQEERIGLLSSPSIGTRDRWTELVESKGLRFAGHRLTRVGKAVQHPLAEDASVPMRD